MPIYESLSLYKANLNLWRRRRAKRMFGPRPMPPLSPMVLRGLAKLRKRWRVSRHASVTLMLEHNGKPSMYRD